MYSYSVHAGAYHSEDTDKNHQPSYNYNTAYLVSFIWKLYHGGCFNLIVSYTNVVYIVIPWQASSVDQQKLSKT